MTAAQITAARLLEDEDDPKDWIMSRESFWNTSLQKRGYYKLGGNSEFCTMVKKYPHDEYTISVMVQDPACYGKALKWYLELVPVNRREFGIQEVWKFFTRTTDADTVAEQLDKVIEQTCKIADDAVTEHKTLLNFVAINLRQALSPHFKQRDHIFEEEYTAKEHVQRLMPEVRLNPRKHGLTGATTGLDVMLHVDDNVYDPIWVGFLQPQGNAWRIASWAWLRDHEARELLSNNAPGAFTGYFSTAKAAAEVLVQATKKHWQQVLSLQGPGFGK